MLETTWFILWSLLWAVYFMLDGFDFGLGSLLPFLGKSENERRKIINSMGPFWDGNEVWLITAGGVTFAAFPKVYAVMFSSLYSALMLLLFALIFRGVAFEFRSKMENETWGKIWDFFIFVGSLAPAILLGVTFANLFKGIPIDGDGVYHGTLLTLLNPYGLAGGVLFLMLFLVHGALWLTIKTEGDLQAKAIKLLNPLWTVLLIVAVGFLAFTAFATDLYANYLATPLLWLIPLLAVVGLLGTRVFIAKAAWWKAWFASSLTIVSVTFFGTVGLFPRMLKSSLNSEWDITAFNGCSSPHTLKIMLGVTLVMVPTVILYQFWTYRQFSGKVTDEDLKDEHAY